MQPPPINAVPLRKLGRPTVPIHGAQPMVDARIQTRAGGQWISGEARAWTTAAVWVWWDDGDGLTRCDWLPADDVRRRR